MQLFVRNHMFLGPAGALAYPHGAQGRPGGRNRARCWRPAAYFGNSGISDVCKKTVAKNPCNEKCQEPRRGPEKGPTINTPGLPECNQQGSQPYKAAHGRSITKQRGLRHLVAKPALFVAEHNPRGWTSPPQTSLVEAAETRPSSG